MKKGLLIVALFLATSAVLVWIIESLVMEGRMEIAFILMLFLHILAVIVFYKEEDYYISIIFPCVLIGVFYLLSLPGRTTCYTHFVYQRSLLTAIFLLTLIVAFGFIIAKTIQHIRSKRKS